MHIESCAVAVHVYVKGEGIELARDSLRPRFTSIDVRQWERVSEGLNRAPAFVHVLARPDDETSRSL